MSLQHRLHSRPFSRRALLQWIPTAPALLAVGRRAYPAPANAGADAVADQPGDVHVDIHNFAFMPPQLTIARGTRVVWTNRDDEAHVVTSASGAFKGSAALDTGDRFALAFDQPGAYPYFCAIHPMMRGTIDVT